MIMNVETPMTAITEETFVDPVAEDALKYALMDAKGRSPRR